MAREHGIKVLLSGAGGDDILTGYRRHFALMQERYWDWAPEWARLGLANGVQMLPTAKPLLRRVRKAFEYADLPEDERLASYFFWAQPSKLKELLSSEMRRQQSEPVSQVLLEALKAIPKDTPPLNRMLFLESKFFLADHNLNYTDKMSMATGVEVRVPLLDPDLVSLAARMPLEFKQHGHEGKWIFKKTMEKYLPHDVIYRPKTGFGAPLRTWLHHELKPLLMDTLSAESLAKRGLFDPQAVASLIQKDASGQVDATYSLFSLICIELWCRIFLDRDQNVEG
jgi:asparagine synthase (glutamine-hydrolysing)